MAGSPPLASRRHGDLARARVAFDDSAEGYLYRPNELLLGGAAVDLMRTEVDSAHVRPDEELNERLSRRGLDVQRWHLPDDVRLPALERVLRGRARAARSHLAVNHVLTGEPLYHGGPGGEPCPVPDLAMPQGPGLAGATRPALAILDTGLPEMVPAAIAETLLGVDGTDIDLLDEDGDHRLDTEAGHGTFIGGLVQRVVPGLATEQRKVLDSAGFGDDLTVALGLAEAQAPVINLSLGGYTDGNRPPAALAAALESLGPDRVVVAAAGNNSRTRRFWPAALPGVVAVAAYDGRTGVSADFTNRGSWVDVCAPGVGLRSTYVHGERTSASGEDLTFSGWASWSGTSFATPLVAAEIARRVRDARGTNARQVVREFLHSLPSAGWPGMGRRYSPRQSLHA